MAVMVCYNMKCIAVLQIHQIYYLILVGYCSYQKYILVPQFSLFTAKKTGSYTYVYEFTV